MPPKQISSCNKPSLRGVEFVPPLMDDTGALTEVYVEALRTHGVDHILFVPEWVESDYLPFREHFTWASVVVGAEAGVQENSKFS